MRGGGEHAFQSHEVLRISELDVVLGAGDEGDWVAGGFEKGGVVRGRRGGRGIGVGAVEGEEEGEVEGLGGLGAVEAIAGHGFPGCGRRRRA